MLDTRQETSAWLRLETKDSGFPEPCLNARLRACPGQGKSVPRAGRKDNPLRNGWWQLLLPGWKLRLPRDRQDPGDLPDPRELRAMTPTWHLPLPRSTAVPETSVGWRPTLSSVRLGSLPLLVCLCTHAHERGMEERPSGRSSGGVSDREDAGVRGLECHTLDTMRVLGNADSPGWTQTQTGLVPKEQVQLQPGLRTGGGGQGKKAKGHQARGGSGLL